MVGWDGWNQLTQFEISTKWFSTQIVEIRKEYLTQQLKIAWKQSLCRKF